MNILRNIPFAIWFYGFLATIQPIKNSIKKYREEGNAEMERTEIRRAEDAWGQALVKKAGITLNIRLTEPLPDGPVVFVSNHQSYWDIPVYFAAVQDRQFGFVAVITSAAAAIAVGAYAGRPIWRARSTITPIQAARTTADDPPTNTV